MSNNVRVPDISYTIMVGRLVRDPEIKPINETHVCSFDIAQKRYRKGKEKTVYMRVETWGKSAEYCAEYMKKGAPVVVEGSIDQDEWQDKETGKKRTAHKINASRIQQLEWANGASGVTQAEPQTEDDIPF